MSLDALEKRLNAFKKKPAVKKSSGGKKKKEEEKPAPVFEGFPEIEAETDDYADDHRWLKKILAIGSAISLIIIGLGLFFILSYSRTSRDVVLEISPIAEDVSRGAPFEIEINVTNNSGAPIKGAAITLTLPQGIIAPDSSRDRSVIKDDVGDVTSGNLVKKSYPLVAIDEVGSKKTITAVLSYSIPNGARFEDRQTQEMEIKNSAIEINMKRPDQILSGSTFSLKVDYENKSDFSFQNLTLEADYPSAFRFDSASVPPASLNNYWRLGSLSAKASGTLSISGHMNLSAGMSATVPVEISASFGGQDYAIGESFVNISPSASPLSLQVLINNQADYAVKIGDVLKYSIQYQNSSGIALEDVKIRATLSGRILNFGTLKTNGAVESGGQILTWDSVNIPALKSLDPGAGGQVDFSLETKKTFVIQQLSDRNLSAKLDVIADSPSVPYYLLASRTSVQAVSEVKISGSTSVIAQAFFNEPGAAKNGGTLPPKAGNATQYTIHWILRNYTTDVNNVEVKAELEPGVKWVSGVSANLGSVPNYNPGDNQVTWNVDRLAATKGILSDPAEAVFQVEATPDESMVGFPQPLIKMTYLRATDNFTGALVESQFIPITTAMLDDGVSAIESIVVR